MTKQCPRCEKHVESLANFCKHCGADIAAFAKNLGKKCKTCRAIVDPLAKFCTFCGDDFDKLAHMGFVGLILTIAILTALVVLGGFAVYGFTVKVPYTVSIPYTSLETYDEIVPVSVEKCSYESEFNQKLYFFAQPNYLKSSGFGSVVKHFPDIVNRCRISGNWITNNQRRLEPKQYCHEAKGTLAGYADEFTQFVTNDAASFDWKGIGQSQLYDPAPEQFKGYSAYTYLCDIRGYEHRNNFVRAGLSGFGTDSLILNWEYFDENTRPAVEVFLDLTCDLGESKCQQVSENRAVEKQREVTKYKEETKYRFLITDWFSR